MKLKTLYLAAALVLASSNAFATVVWMSGMAVRGVQSLWDGGFYLYGPPGIAPVCQSGNIFLVRANSSTAMTEAGVKAALASVLTAFASGKSLTFTYDNANNLCYVGTVMINP